MKFEHTQVWGFEHAVRGMRNPMNSHNKSDSYYDVNNDFVIGKNDINLMQKLIKAGPEHRKFMRQIFVSVDITAPFFWFKEFDVYKIGTTANSTSTMHKLASTPITLNCFETDDYDSTLVLEEGQEVQRMTTFVDEPVSWGVDSIIRFCESLRQKYLETKDVRYWKELIRWLPEGWLQTRTITMNYENLLTICKQRRSHKLNEWSGINDSSKPNFIAWAKTLPLVKELIFLD